MKKLLIGAAALVVARAALRRLGPVLGERAMRACGAMFARMPADFLPKRMLRGIKEIREQSTQILRQLQQEEERRRAVVAAGV